LVASEIAKAEGLRHATVNELLWLNSGAARSLAGDGQWTG